MDYSQTEASLYQVLQIWILVLTSASPAIASERLCPMWLLYKRLNLTVKVYQASEIHRLSIFHTMEIIMSFSTATDQVSVYQKPSHTGHLTASVVGSPMVNLNNTKHRMVNVTGRYLLFISNVFIKCWVGKYAPLVPLEYYKMVISPSLSKWILLNVILE